MTPATPTRTASAALRPLHYQGHIAGLDVLRGLAILGVLVYHGVAGNLHWAAWSGVARMVVHVATYGSTGVHLFFLLSGFLITGILLDGRTKPHAMRTFYVRRALRILPAYLVMLIVLKAAGVIGWRFVLACLLYIANMAKLVGASNSEYGSLWSLAVEEQFYLVWPWIVRRLSLRALARVATALCIATVLLRVVLFHAAPTADHYYKTWDNADYLLYGALIAIGCRSGALHRGNIGRLIALLLGAGGAALLVLAFAPAVDPTGWLAAIEGGCGLLPLVAVYAALLLVTLARNEGRTPSNPVARGLIFLGYISYGLYLVHSFVYELYDRWTAATALRIQPPHFGTQLLRALVGAVVSILIAWLSRATYEEWFLRRKWGRPAPAADPGAATHVPPSEVRA